MSECGGYLAVVCEIKGVFLRNKIIKLIHTPKTLQKNRKKERIYEEEEKKHSKLIVIYNNVNSHH